MKVQLSKRAVRDLTQIADQVIPAAVDGDPSTAVTQHERRRAFALANGQSHRPLVSHAQTRKRRDP